MISCGEGGKSMTSSGGSGGYGSSGSLVGAAIDALPPDIQAMVRPGKTSDRIQHALNWASRPDPRVVQRHHARDRNIQTFDDIQSAPLSQMDAVAREITRSYRTRALLTGAATGLPGGLWAVVAAGADVQLTAVYAVRMAAQVAQAYGYNTSLLEEQAHLADVLAIMTGVDTLRGIGSYLTREGLVHMVPEVLPKLMARLSVEITADQTAKWAGRIIPGLGAVVGGAIDYSFLRIAGQRAMQYYHSRYVHEHAVPAAATPAQLPAAGATTPEAATTPSPTMPPVGAPAAPVTQLDTLPAPPTAVASVAAPAVPATTPTPTPADLPHKHRKPPENIALYLSLFAFFMFAAVVLACGALAYLAITGIGDLLPH
jgi:hypothetical protein